MTDVFTLRSGQILSDHFPLCFSLAVECSHPRSSSSTPRSVNRILYWSDATESDIERFCAMVANNITAFPSVTVSHLPVQVILPFWIPMLRI